jgi:phosphate:Na+ symporter
MAKTAVKSLKESLETIKTFSPEKAKVIREKEEITDHYEDILGTYLVKLSTTAISEKDSAEAAKLLKIIGDFERISDHSVNILEASEEMENKGLSFTNAAKNELSLISSAVSEILDLTLSAFLNDDLKTAQLVEPLEEVIDNLKEQMRTRHIFRLQQGDCSIEAGFVLLDILTSLERTADHCSNIAGCIIDMSHNELHLHESLREFRNDSREFKESFTSFSDKYRLI